MNLHKITTSCYIQKYLAKERPEWRSNDGKEVDIMEYKNGEYFFTKEESGIIFGQSVHSDEAAMERRNRFFADMDDSLQITYLQDGGMIVDALDFIGWK